MPSDVMLYVEVAGCPTICQHCWAQGVSYPAMPLADIAFVLEQADATCAARCAHLPERLVGARACAVGADLFG
jgi:hypothetical protein